MAKRGRGFVSVRRALFYAGIAMLVGSFFLPAASGLSLRGAPTDTSLLGWQCMSESIRALLHPLGWKVVAKHPSTMLMFLVLLAHPLLVFVPRLDTASSSPLWSVGVVLWGMAVVNLAVIGPVIVQGPGLGYFVWTGAFMVSGSGFFVPGQVGVFLMRSGQTGEKGGGRDDGPDAGAGPGRHIA